MAPGGQHRHQPLGASLWADRGGCRARGRAGDPELREQERVYALLDYETPDAGAEQFEAFRDMLADNGIEIATHVPLTLDLNRAQETARTVVVQLEEAGVTTVIITPDPLTPASITEEATAQDYFPEWILGNNYLADTEQFARTYDQQQWGNGFAVSVADAAAEGLDPWDPEAEGVDETGEQGAGMYRFANGGQRYSLGEIPETPEEAGSTNTRSGALQGLG